MRLRVTTKGSYPIDGEGSSLPGAESFDLPGERSEVRTSSSIWRCGGCVTLGLCTKRGGSRRLYCGTSYRQLGDTHDRHPLGHSQYLFLLGARCWAVLHLHSGVPELRSPPRGAHRRSRGTDIGNASLTFTALALTVAPQSRPRGREPTCGWLLCFRGLLLLRDGARARCGGGGAG